jgi:hypothetical protein
VVAQSVLFLLGEVSSAALEAVILTGSAARGEASVLPTPTGFRLLGDLEFLVIARAPLDWPALRRRMVEVSRRATRDIGDEGRAVSIEYGPAGLVYLQQHIRPSIFAYDLQVHGQVVWGRQDILTEIRPFGVADIPREDALNLIMNRLIEFALVAAPACQAGLSTGSDRPYHLAKIVLDLPGSALAFTGHYISRYSERGGGFRALLEARPDLCQAFPDVDHFHTALEQAIACKLEPTQERLAALALSASANQYAAWIQALWLWEARHLLGLHTANFGSVLAAYISREPLAMRLKGWAKFLRHPLRPARALSWSRMTRLLCRASPQTLTYAAAVLTQAGTCGAWGLDWKDRVASLSPVSVQGQDSATIASEIGTLWQWLIRNN